MFQDPLLNQHPQQGNPQFSQRRRQFQHRLNHLIFVFHKIYY
jgi:hypothetical protein